VVVDPDQLQQVFLNLVLNALDAMPRGGRLRIAIQPRTLANPERAGAPEPCVTVSFEDSGSGITPENSIHVFDPFFTTKEAGQGTGLGLSVSYGIVEEHGGWFELDSRPGEGTRISVVLPVNGEPKQAIA
jgi:signal transduction histidine kinase